MLNFFKKNWHFILLIVLCFWAIRALLLPGYFPSHDDEQIARIIEIDKGLHDGQIPVRWIPDLGFGFGYPLFNFYPPLIYYAADLIHFAGFQFIDSAKTIFIIGFLSSAFFMYLWTKEHFGTLGAIMAAVLYVYAPYHGVEVYVRGSMPDFSGYALIPLLFWLSDRLFETKKINYSIAFGIFIAILPLTHILKIVSVLPFLGAYVLFLLLRYRKESKKMLPLVVLSALIGFGISAFFLLPAIIEKGYTMVDKINTGELYSYKLHFVCIKQLFYSPWGYGASLPDCRSDLSFELGKVHILIVLVSLLFLTQSFIQKKLSKFKTTVLVFFMFILSGYLTNSHSSWIWDRIKLLSYLQFPWRFLTPSAVFSSFLGAFVIGSIEKNFGKNAAVIAVIVLGASAIILVASDFRPQRQLLITDSFYNNLEDMNWRVSKASFEFVPTGVGTRLSDIKTTQIDLTRNDIPQSPYNIIDGKARVKVLSNKSQSKLFEIDSKGESVIRINTFSFPGWKTFLDGKEVKYSDNNKLKLITLNIPSGIHNLNLEFTNTFPRAVGNAITLVTGLNLLGFGFFRLWIKLKS